MANKKWKYDRVENTGGETFPAFVAVFKKAAQGEVPAEEKAFDHITISLFSHYGSTVLDKEELKKAETALNAAKENKGLPMVQSAGLAATL